MRLAILAAMSVVAACEETPDAKAVPPERPPAEARATGPVPIDRLFVEARRHIKADQTLSHVAARYVKSDGTLDPSYSELELRFIGPPPRPRGPIDDPDRPTGAPVATRHQEPPKRQTCAVVSWRQGVWSSRACNPVVEQVLAPRCTVPIIWERAIGHGAPPDAVAKVTISGGDRATWVFSIEDKLRNVSFFERFEDDCGLVAEAPDPTVGPDTLVDAIDRKIIQNTIGTVKADVSACGTKSTSRGSVKVSVKVAPDGSTAVTIKTSPDPALGACVKAAVERATFPPTRTGGSFSYPFVF
ncbi:MAG: hypothetical protein AB7T06_23950 [Kofleriaceae bacterium]